MIANFCYIKRLLFFLIVVTANQVYSQEEFNVLEDWLYYKNSDNSLYPHLTKEAIKLLNKRALKIKSLKDWKKRQSDISHTLLDIIGPFPKRTPLNAEILRTIEKGEYRIEHIIFQSQPGFYVTSSLFIPSSLDNGRKIPAIIYCSGHTSDAYRNKAYQQVIL